MGKREEEDCEVEASERDQRIEDGGEVKNRSWRRDEPRAFRRKITRF